MSKKHQKSTDSSNSYQTKLSMFYGGQKKHQGSQQPVNVSPASTNQKEVHQKQTVEQKRENNHIRKQSREVSNRSHTDRMSSLSARSSSPSVIIQKAEKKEAPRKLNVLFYLNKMPSQPYGEHIDTMHQLWYNDYEKLERNHSFIQWIFPNSFQSRFNMHARPLSAEQAEQFKTNPQIIRRYLKSYEMMLAFYGMKLKDRLTGEVMRSRHPNYKQRFFKTLLTSFHNHMRITRILCSLNETGFGRFAAQLCKFLKNQIYMPGGQMFMLKKYNVYKDWEPFEKFNEDSKEQSIYFDRVAKHKVTQHSKFQLKEEKLSKQDELRSPRSPSQSKNSPHHSDSK